MKKAILQKFSRWGIGIAVMLAAAQTVSAADFSQWNRTMSFTFSGYTRPEPLTNFPALVVLTNVPGFDYGQFLSGSHDDLRFTDASQTNELAYEVERWDTNGSSLAWVRLPALVDSTTAIYAFWGKTGQTAPACTTNGAVWDANYVGVWHMAQTNAQDSTSNGFNGAASGAVTQATGMVGGANDFHTNTDYIAIPDSPLFTLNSSYTISTWVQPDPGVTNHEGLVGTYNGSGFIMAIDNTPTNILRVWASGVWMSSGVTVPDGIWKHLAYTRNGTNGSFYVDGVLVATVTNALPGSDGGQLNLGAGGTNWPAYRFDGKLDEIRLSRTDRSSNWMWACWMNQASNSAFAAQGAVTSLDGSPTIATAVPTDVATNAVTLNGILVSTGMASSAVTVYWGLTDGGTNKGDWAHTNDIGDQAVGAVSNTVSLSADGVYYYRFYATNLYGEAWASTSERFISGEVSIQATVPTAAEDGPASGTFTISRPESTTNLALAINYTIGGTATPDVDYGALPASVTMPAGVSATNLIVTPVYETLVEGDETVVVTLLPGKYATMSSSNSATVTIIDSELAHWYVATNGLDTRTGKSWAEAYLTLSNAVAHAVAGDTVLVSNGVYTLAANVVITNGIKVWGVGGWSNTVVNGGGVTRCFMMSNVNAVVDGFTISNGLVNGTSDTTGARGGGVYLHSGTLQNCLVTKNRGTSSGNGSEGAGVYMKAGKVLYCTITLNTVSGTSWQRGGGVCMSGNGLVDHCLIQGNVAGNGGGGGVYMVGGDVLRNSLVIGNYNGDSQSTYRGGGAVMADDGNSGRAYVYNCTIVGNKGVGINRGRGKMTIANSIIYFNVDTSGNPLNHRNLASTDANSSFLYSCTTPDPLPSNASNVTDDPMFVDAGSNDGTNYVVGDLHLQYGSPAIDSGTTIASITNDFEGTPRPVNGGTPNGAVYDMGTYEMSFASSPLSCAINASAAHGIAPLTNIFTAAVVGGNAVTNIEYYWWDFGPGTTPQEGDDKRIVTNIFSVGQYPITLVVSNDLGTVASNTVPVTIPVVGVTAYVKPSGTPQFPYDTWAKAATNIQDAVDAEVVAYNSGCTNPLVLVTNGVYTLTTDVPPLATTYIFINKGITVRSVEGSTNTTVSGNNVTRCFWLDHAKAVVDGFTIRNGNASGATAPFSQGGGVHIGDAGGTVQNCVITLNQASGTGITVGEGPGVYMSGPGKVLSCTITSNSALGSSWQRGGGVCMSGNGLVQSCLIQGNVAGNGGGGGVYMQPGDVLRNSVIIGNACGDSTNSTYRGGGTVMLDAASGAATVDGCTIVGNKGGGINGRNNANFAIRNSIVYSNVDTSDNPMNTRFLASGVMTYSCTTPAPSGGTGNKVADPVFAKPGTGGYGTSYIPGDLRLNVGSPCLNTGTNQTWMTNALDMAGSPRIKDDITDMGAYEGTFVRGTIFTIR